ncbi:MAG: hypothetical protein ACXACR_14050 [Candidatus Hodarchaeales archaeon]
MAILVPNDEGATITVSYIVRIGPIITSAKEIRGFRITWCKGQITS